MRRPRTRCKRRPPRSHPFRAKRSRAVARRFVHRRDSTVVSMLTFHHRPETTPSRRLQACLACAGGTQNTEKRTRQVSLPRRYDARDNCLAQLSSTLGRRHPAVGGLVRGNPNQTPSLAGPSMGRKEYFVRVCYAKRRRVSHSCPPYLLELSQATRALPWLGRKFSTQFATLRPSGHQFENLRLGAQTISSVLDG